MYKKDGLGNVNEYGTYPTLETNKNLLEEFKLYNDLIIYLDEHENKIPYAKELDRSAGSKYATSSDWNFYINEEINEKTLKNIQKYISYGEYILSDTPKYRTVTPQEKKKILHTHLKIIKELYNRKLTNNVNENHHTK